MVGTSEGVGVKRYWEISWGIMQDAVIIKMINAMIDLEDDIRIPINNILY